MFCVALNPSIDHVIGWLPILPCGATPQPRVLSLAVPALGQAGHCNVPPQPLEAEPHAIAGVRFVAEAAAEISSQVLVTHVLAVLLPPVVPVSAPPVDDPPAAAAVLPLPPVGVALPPVPFDAPAELPPPAAEAEVDGLPPVPFIPACVVVLELQAIAIARD